MPKKYYLPLNEAQLLIWYFDFESAVQTHGTLVGMSAAEKTQVTTNLAVLQHAINGGQLITTDKQEWTAYKNILLYSPIGTGLPGTPTDANKGVLPLGSIAAIIDWTTTLIERIRDHFAMTEAIAQDLGIIGAEEGPGAGDPEFEGFAETDFNVRLLFSMKGFKSIEIQRMRGAEVVFSFLAIDTGKPYVDGDDPLVPGQPESRLYRARFRDNNDQPVGDWSPTITVVAKA